jgi:RNA recognition motif-containing protein
MVQNKKCCARFCKELESWSTTQGNPSMSKKLFVGNLSFNTTEDQLRELFAQHGTVISAKLVMDRETGRSRGFGFIEMNEADVAKAQAALNGQQVDGRPLRIDEARERTDRGGDRGGMGGGDRGGMGGGDRGGRFERDRR